MLFIFQDKQKELMEIEALLEKEHVTSKDIEEFKEDHAGLIDHIQNDKTSSSSTHRYVVVII